MSVRVRFAPSPTGALHVGSARTALFNWLFAKHNNGTFILRIEDTDKTRSNPAFLKDIDSGLAYLGISADEGPIFQSERVDLYRKQAENLLQTGKAEREDEAIVFPVPQQDVIFTDLLRGDIKVNTSLFTRIVLIKSDGLPAYNFACVVDDIDMKISHIIRGDDHIANTPKQVVLYKALGANLPVFAHLPLIVGIDRARLSKRHGATSVTDYQETGYLPDAFFNYLSLLGWSPGDNREVITPKEIVDLFDLKRVKKAAAQFDQRKLDWINSQYIRKLSVSQLAEFISKRLEEKEIKTDTQDKLRLERIAALLQDRLKRFDAIEDEHIFFFQDMPTYEEKAVAEVLRKEGTANYLQALRGQLNTLDSFETKVVEDATRGLAKEKGIEPKALIHPTRVALTGKSVSPPLFETMSILGKSNVLKRLDEAIKLAKHENA